MTHRIITGDCIEGMSILDAGSVQTCVTSPPYWGLRDYGTAGQHGLEATPDEYVANMVAVFRAVRRVLRDDGTLWLNLGDSYCGSGGAGNQFKAGGIAAQGVQAPSTWKEFDTKVVTQRIKGLKPKDLVGIPWRVAFALQADGWYLRQDIIWHKPNPMPESVTDRCTKAHEYIFLLTKSQRYYFDNEAIKEPLQTPAHAPGNTKLDASRNDADQMKKVWGLSGTRNRRSVWTVTTKPFKGAHFATFPPALIEPCVLAGTSEHGCCSKCGASWKREVETHRTFESGSGKSGNLPEGKYGKNLQGGEDTKDIRMGPVCHSKTVGWVASCDCKDEKVVPCTVLDPFTGSGTTAVVSLKHGRNFVGTELNPEYVALAEQRISLIEGCSEVPKRIQTG